MRRRIKGRGKKAKVDMGTSKLTVMQIPKWSLCMCTCSSAKPRPCYTDTNSFGTTALKVIP